MHNLPYVRLEANTRCYCCNGQLFAGQQVTVIWDEQIRGWKHKHKRRGLCHHRSREVDHSLVMEVIENERNTIPETAR